MSKPEIKAIEVPGRKLEIGGKPIIGPTPDMYPWLMTEYAGLKIVLFWTTEKGLTNRNVRAYNDKGELVWIVEPIVPDAQALHPYCALGWSETRGQMGLRGYYGSRVLLDAKDGTIHALGTT